MAKSNLPMAGIDVGKATLDVAVLNPDGTLADSGTFRNDAKGVAALLKSLPRVGGELCPVCVDTTGGYENLACRVAHDTGHAVFAAQSLLVKKFAESLGLRNKTDRADARVIARFAQERSMAPWKPKGKTQTELAGLVKMRQGVVEDIVRQQNILARQEGRETAKSCRRQIRFLEAEQTRVEKAIRELVADTPEFAEADRLLCTIPGVGPCTVAVLCATVDPRDFGDPRKMAAFIGLTPGKRQSGSSLDRTRLTSLGNRVLRRAMFLAALSARRHNPVVRAFAERLAKNRPQLAKKQVILACAHKLARIIYGVWTKRTPFDPAA